MAKQLNKSVLIVEDDQDVRRFAARVLQLEGYQVIEAADGTSGLNYALAGNISLILLDLTLPGLDGWAIMEEVRKHRDLDSVAIAVFSASAGSEDRARARASGASRFLVKPASAGDLVRMVGQLLPPRKLKKEGLT